VNDLNDVNPVFSSGSTANVNENVATTTVVYDANATDADVSFGVITYTLGGTDAGLLNINAVTGEVRLNASPNFEAKASYSFNVIATQGATATTQSVTLGINDLNDTNPAFSSGSTANVNENVATTTVVYDANATDADTSFGAITYTLGGADAGLLNINGATGEVRLNASPDREAKASYTFNVIATQGATATTQSVTLGINDLNDTNPVFSSGATANVNENAASSTVVYDANATDADSTFGAITYTLGGADAGLLNINAATGEVRLNTSADFEVKAQYLFNVVATQGATATTQGVTLSTNDLNEGFVGGFEVQTASIEAGSTQALLGLAAFIDPQNDPLTYTITTLPAQGTAFLDTGVAVTNNQALTEAQFLGLKFSSPEGATALSMVFSVDDGHGTTDQINLTINVTAADPDNLTGGAGSQRLDGAGGDDTINGGADADTMFGGSGNDIFFVDNAGDQAIEGVGKGIDKVYSSVTHTLAANVENLVLQGAAANGFGNDLGNIMVGTGSANHIYGNGGNDTIYGNGGLDQLRGNDGNDTLYGGLGNDTLTGGANNDSFVFNTTLNATTNRDMVTDFNPVDDTFLLDNAIFTQLGRAIGMDPNFFRAGSAALDANDYIVYDQSTGGLMYDSNGNGAGGAILFAVLTTKPVLTASDFVVI
jgi:Ca2+-binding RTX toxin-like protein